MIDLIDKRTGDAFCENEQEVMKKAFIPLLKLVNNFQGIQGRSDAGNPDMTVEIIDCHMTLNPMAPYLDFGGVRRTNADYAEAEINWFMSRNRCIKGWPMIEDNTIWSRIATDKGMVNSNYGWCAFSPENGNGKRSQYDFAIEQLLKHPDGRQALIYYGRPQIQWEWNDGKHAKYDMICNILTQLLIRQNRLYYIQTIRSNDAIFGFINNFIWHCYMYQTILNEINSEGLDVQPGSIYWNAGSFHIYEKHWKVLQDIVDAYNEYQSIVIGNAISEGDMLCGSSG